MRKQSPCLLTPTAFLQLVITSKYFFFCIIIIIICKFIKRTMSARRLNLRRRMYTHLSTDVEQQTLKVSTSLPRSQLVIDERICSTGRL